MTSIALAHDVLGARAGGERVIVALSQVFPASPIHTLLHEPAASFSALTNQDVRTTWLNQSAWLRRNYRSTLPVAALTFASRRIEADVTICSTSGLSHHLRTSGAKVVYCHTPARWLHDPETYLAGFGPAVRVAARAAAPPFRLLDRKAMRSADRVIANSSQVAAEIAAVYDIEARVITPCSTLELEGSVEAIHGVEPGFVLSPTRPLGYKRLDVLLAAAQSLPDQTFVQIGGGPHRQAMFANAPANVVSLGAVTDAQLRWAYRNAAVVALTCAEDFGLVPLEAAANGVHTVAPDARGIRDHDASHLTVYSFASAAGLVEAIKSAPSPTGIRDQERLGQQDFATAMRDLVSELT